MRTLRLRGATRPGQGHRRHLCTRVCARHHSLACVLGEVEPSAEVALVTCEGRGQLLDPLTPLLGLPGPPASGHLIAWASHRGLMKRDDKLLKESFFPYCLDLGFFFKATTLLKSFTTFYSETGVAKPKFQSDLFQTTIYP